MKINIKKNIVIIRIENGLGNQLFQYAYARALKEKMVDVRLDLDKSYATSFFIHKNNDFRENGIQNFNITLPTINVEKYKKYNYIKRDSIKNKIIFNLAKHGLWKYKFYEELVQHDFDKPLNIKGNYYIRAWFEDERYFKQIQNILFKELTPKKKIRISKKLHQALEYKESVSLHVRRGDFVKIKNVLSVTYYKKAIDLIRSKNENPLFIIFSDDLDWVKRNLYLEQNCIYVNEDGTLEDYEELFLMSRCKSNIISNSTFSWWGAWLNRNPEKIVVAPKKPWLSKQGNIIPDDWITL